MSPAPTFLSRKSIPTPERLIFALDMPSPPDAKKIVGDLGDSVQFYKVGLELFTSRGGADMVSWLTAQNKKVFLDLKFYDVPQTVGSAVRQIRECGAAFTTVHGHDAMLEAAVKEKGNVKILAVTVLTSMGQGDFEKDFGFAVDLESLVLSRAKRAWNLGCDGVISSGLEIPALRKSIDEKLLVVTPGVRPVAVKDDQKRTVNVEQAFQNGADYIVVGRPIRDHHGFNSPREAAESIQKTIKILFG